MVVGPILQGPNMSLVAKLVVVQLFFSSELTNFDFRKNILTNSHVILVVALGT